MRSSRGDTSQRGEVLLNMTRGCRLDLLGSAGKVGLPFSGPPAIARRERW